MKHIRSKKRIICILFVLSFCFLAAVTVSAQQETGEPETIDELSQLADALELGSLTDALPQETYSFLQESGLDPQKPEALLSVSSQSAVALVWDAVKECFTAPFAVLTSLFVLIILTSVSRSVIALSSPMEELYSCITAMVVCAVLVLPLSECVTRVCTAMDAVGVFLNAFVPIYCTALALAGHTLRAAGYQSLLLVVSQIITTLSYRVFSPLCGMMIAVNISSGVSKTVNGKSFAAGISKTVKWCMGFSMMLFSGVLSLNTASAGAADSLALRTGKFVIGSSVPVIGSFVSESYTAVRASLGILRTGIGIYGVFAVLLLLLPVFAEVLLYRLILSIASITSDLFGLKDLSDVFSAVGDTASVMLSLIITLFLMFVMSLSIVVTFGGSV